MCPHTQERGERGKKRHVAYFLDSSMENLRKPAKRRTIHGGFLPDGKDKTRNGRERSVGFKLGKKNWKVKRSEGYRGSHGRRRASQRTVGRCIRRASGRNSIRKIRSQKKDGGEELGGGPFLRQDV